MRTLATPRASWLLALVFLVVSAGSAAPQVPGGPETRPAALDSRVHAAVVDSLAAQLSRGYVDPDTARLIAEAVRRQVASGAYDTVTSPARFAELLTRDLRSVNGDVHLALLYDPARSSAPPHHAAHGHGAPSLDPRTPADDRSARENFGLSRVEILPGNVGYLDIASFNYPHGYEDAIASALRFLERTDAIIMDVRRNVGGTQMGNYLLSHFLPPEPAPLLQATSRYEGETHVVRSVEEVKGPRRTDVPLYVLTGRATASAAEAFAFILKNQGRATLVGERTRGAGNQILPFPVGYGFTAIVSHARSVDPRSGRGWEREGVYPDHRVPMEEALDAAYLAALATVMERSDDARHRKSLALTAAAVEARARGVRPRAADLASLPGSYEGGRRVTAQDGRLWYSARDGLPPVEMIPLADGWFGLLTGERLALEGSGRGARLVVESVEGTRLSYPREAESQR